MDIHGPPDGPELDPAMHIVGDPDQIKALQGPFKVFVDIFFLHRPLANGKT